eukprot:417142_1
MSFEGVELHVESSLNATTRKYKSFCGVSVALLIGILIIHYDSFINGQNNHYARTQFEYGLVKSLTNQHLIHEKKWSLSYEIFDCILGKWNLNKLIKNDVSHYMVINKFFQDIQRYKNQNEFEIHQITLIIRDMHDIIVELDHFESKELDHSLRGFYSKNPWDARVTHTIFKFKQEMKDHLYKCLTLWNNKHYFKSGQSLGKFVGEYLFYEKTPQDFEQHELKDLFNMEQNHNNKHETTVTDTPRKDPLDKWRRKAKFRTF